MDTKGSSPQFPVLRPHPRVFPPSPPVARSGHPMPPTARPRSRHRTTCVPAPALNRIRNTSNTLAELDTRSKRVSAAKFAGPPLVVVSSLLLPSVPGREPACLGPKASRAHCVCRLVRVLPRSARRWGESRRIKKTMTRISTNSRMMLPSPARVYKKKWFSMFLPACLLPFLLPGLLFPETRRAQ